MDTRTGERAFPKVGVNKPRKPVFAKAGESKPKAVDLSVEVPKPAKGYLAKKVDIGGGKQVEYHHFSDGLFGYFDKVDGKEMFIALDPKDPGNREKAGQYSVPLGRRIFIMQHSKR